MLRVALWKGPSGKEMKSPANSLVSGLGPSAPVKSSGTVVLANSLTAIS